MKSFIIKFFFNTKRFSAFTLAEVLIVLGLIGIVAEMVIPDLILDVKDRAIAAQIKEAYSTLTQATQKLYFDGEMDTSSESALRESYGNAYIYLEQGADSDYSITDIFTPDYRFYKSNSGPDLSTWTRNRVASLKNGSYISFFIERSNCTASPYGGGTLSGMICAQIQMDVNGSKSPNMLGKDFVNFWLVRKNGVYRIFPVGSEGGRKCQNPGDAGTDNTGEGCTNYYITGQTLP